MKMRIRIFKRKIALLLCGLTLSVFLLLYVLINYQIPPATLVDDALQSRQILLRNDVDNTKIHKLQISDGHVRRPDNNLINRFDEIVNIRRPGAQCSVQTDVTPVVDLNMLDLYREASFDNPDGGVWKQGWKVEITPGRWSEDNVLKVFVVPHSHNDPGWIQTFEEYYERSTKQIFANMMRHLSDNPRMRFIWAEISYFARWYEKAGKETQSTVKRLVNRKQLEFVSGGWVMPDEANSHWYSIVEQLTEGHQYLKQNLNITPSTSWSIDPFGHSPTLAYVLKNSGFENHLIQRTHYVVKRELAKKKQLEFNWRQVWDTDGSTSLFTHMMPFYSYDVPHTCGPDPKICCQFDFKRLPGYGLSCPWRVAPQKITDDNVAARAELVVDQWKKKAELYNTKSVLIPLGDDFRYTQSTEWEAQRENFEKLFDYINGESNLNVEAKFATLSEYFESVKKDQNVQDFPIVNGDFFTYADRDDHYWSGYFTTRPYHKRMDRVLMNYIRSAEMLASWSKWDQAEFKFDELLTDARRQHSLFQHHDGITGTEKDHVVQDYTRRMEEALQSCRHIIQQSVYRLLTKETVYEADSKFAYFSLDESVSPGGTDDNRPTIILGDDLPKKFVVLHNSLPYQRSELVEFYIAKPYVIVTDADESITYSQISPVWSWNKGHFGGMQPQASSTKFRLMFKATVPPLGLAVYIIHAKKSAEVVSMGTTFTKTTIYSHQPFTINLNDYPYTVDFSEPRNIGLKDTEGVSASFNRNGLLTSIATDAALNLTTNVQFLKYSTRKSGAYLFLPSNEAQPLPLGEPVLLVSRGPMESSVAVSLPFGLHQTILRESSIEIRNLIDIHEMDNSEIIMRINTNIENDETFYTDLNGLTFIRRERLSKIPLQANYYPIPTGIFIEDENLRFSVFTAQPLGGSSLSTGSIEIMQDRRLNQDDERGLGQAILDNRPVLNIFRFVLEARDRCRKLSPTYPGAFLTPLAFLERESLLHPMEKLVFNENDWIGMLPMFGANHRPLQTGIEIVALRPLKNSRGIIVHRTSLDQCDAVPDPNDHETISLQKLLGETAIAKLYRTPLTFVQKLAEVNVEHIDLCPMETKAFIIPS